MNRFAVVAVAIPLVGAGITGLASRIAAKGPGRQYGRTVAETSRRIAAAAAAFAFVVLLCSTAVDWAAGPRGSAGVGGLFALLTTAVWFAVLFSARDCDGKRPCLLYALLLLLEAAALGVFLADDVRWFCLSLETSTLVLFLLIGGWGGGQNEAVARKFLFYNLAGDLLVLIALLGVVVAAARMSSESVSGPRHHLTYSLSALIQDVPRLASEDISGQEYWGHARRWLLTALIAGLALKTPLAPFHTWFAAAVAEGPLCFGVALLGAGSRVGAYALVRIAGPLAGDIGAWGDLLVALIVFGAFYESLLALAYGDLRKMTACASLSQASLAIAGFFTRLHSGTVGVVLLTLAGGLASSLLLFSFGSLEQRFGTRDLSAVQGTWRRMPQLAGILLFAVLSMIGVPALCGFPGLYSTLAALFASDWLTAILALFAGLVVAWALFWMVERVVFGPALSADITSPEAEGRAFQLPSTEGSGDLRMRDLLPIAPLIAGSIVLGIRPQAVVDLIQTSLGISLSP